MALTIGYEGLGVIAMINDLDKITPFSGWISRMFMTETIAKPLFKVAEAVLDKLPEPTHANTWHPNTHVLIETRDEFFKHCFLRRERLNVLKAVFNFVIIKYDSSPPWRMILDWCVEQWLQKEWKPKWYGETKQNFLWWHE